MEEKLIGALIGLARATEGNEEEITEEMNQLVIDGLCAALPGAHTDEETITGLIHRIHQEKRRLVPNCSYCTASCGRTDDFDVRKLKDVSEDIQTLKSRILLGLCKMATLACPAQVYPLFYQALFSLGADWEQEELLSIVREIA